jgi:GAF domain-containing protein/anti-sigma regulatory factor (Ser/Thr protein kinase)
MTRAEPDKKQARVLQHGQDAAAREAAISDILRVISSSPSDLQPVFDTILEHTIRLCEGDVAALWQFDGEKLCFAASKNATPEAVAHSRAHPLALGTYNPTPQAALERRIVHVLDVFANPDYRPLIPVGTSGKRPNAGTVLAVPLVRENELLGAITIWRYEKRLFSERQVELVKTFTAQAVIAIQNVRLFNETKEALEQQTATAGILRVITSSPTDLKPVMATVVENAARLAEADHALIGQTEGGNIRWLAAHGCALPGDTRPISRDVPSGRAMLDLQSTQVEDVAQIVRDPNVERAYRELGVRSIFATPLVREGRAIGVLLLRRTAVRPFTDKQVALLKTFADQAAIAIENVRLFNETKESLERQTATAEILRVISGTPTDTRPVFDAIVQSGLNVFAGAGVGVAIANGERVRIVAAGGILGPMAAKVDMPRSRESATGAAIVDRAVVNIVDTEAPDAPPYARDNGRLLGFRAIAAAPMLREGEAIGAIGVTLSNPGGLSDKQLDLLKTFADQAVIAIENVRLFNETKEALERQTATADILRVISGSPTNVQPVFEAILDNATKLCEAQLGFLFLPDGQIWNMVSHRGASDEAQALYRNFRVGPHTGLGRMIRDRQPVHIEDLVADAATSQRDPLRIATIEKLGARTFLAVPLLKEGAVIGAVVIYRKEVRPFGEPQIRLLSTFADQAVIAIENVRLFNETKESLERQTATSEILRVIAGSPDDVQPVFDTIVRNAVALCNGMFANAFRYDGELLHFAASSITNPEARKLLAEVYPRRPDKTQMSGRAVLAKAVVRMEDALSDPDYDRRHAQVGGWRRMLGVPMLREGNPIGAIVVAWAEPGPISKVQELLLQTFADQAVIAIENVRLFNETKEALEQQTAISEILRVISGSPSDVKPVLHAVAERAARICGAQYADVVLVEAQGLRVAASMGDIGRTGLTEIVPLDRTTVMGRSVIDRMPLHIVDLLTQGGEFPRGRAMALEYGHRTILCVPLVRENTALGTIMLRRTEVRPFEEKHIALLQTFADQAAIAIQNVRLFNETKEALDQQKASAEVLGAISSSIADTTPVFEKILESCERLFEGKLVGINLVGDDGLIHMGAYHGPGREGLEKVFPLQLDRESGSGSAIVERRVIHCPDLENGADVPPAAQRGGRATGIKSEIFAPMMWDGRGQGVVFVGREYTGPFSDKEIALLKTFADQAVIAIQNARLFREIQEKSAQLEVANKHKSDFLANMSHELRTPLNAIIGFSEALMDRMFGEVNDKQADYLKDIHESGRHLLSLINDILDLSKIEAGRMDLELSSFHLPTALSNAMTLIRERAQRHGIELGLEVDQQLGEFQADERKFKQIMLNLLSNAVKFTPDGGRVDVCAKKDTDKIEIAVKDTGIGIAPEDQAVVFEEFKQVGRDQMRKAEGTGLGLALTRRFVELHGGAIRLESTPGKGSTFTVSLPIRQ